MEAEIERLKAEINQEEQAKEMLEQSVKDLQETTKELNEELEGLEENSGEDEWKARYHEQADMNKNLEKQIQMLQDKMRELKGEIEQSGIHGNATELDQLNEIDLKKLIKQLEREKHELDGTLKDLEWQLNTEAKSRYRIDEELREYKVAMNEVNFKKVQRPVKDKTPEKPSITHRKDIRNKFPVGSRIPTKQRYYGIPDNQRIIDPRKGPVKRTALAGRLPKIDYRDGANSVKSSPGPQGKTSDVPYRGFSSAEEARTKYNREERE